MRPLLFLDFDDVICVNSPYGCRTALGPNPPADLHEKLWHAPAVQTLRAILDEHEPSVVITSSWLLLMNRQRFETLFRSAGFHAVVDALHVAWEAPPDRGSRLQAIERWLDAHHTGEPLVILDDTRSGTGLQGSRLDQAGCVVLCEQNIGLHAGHLPAVRAALTNRGLLPPNAGEKNA